MNEDILSKRIKNLKGNKYGLLTVTNYYGNALWECECDCGNNIITLGNSLKTGNTKSCGCLVKNRKRKGTRGNTYTEHKDYYTGISSNTKEEFYIDKEDYEICKKYIWMKSNNGYMVTNASDDNGITLLHRLIMGCEQNDGKIVDHINGNRLDNRKNNLRFVDSYQNAWNSDGYGESGIKGVRLRKGKYEARIIYKGEPEYLGRFDNISDAQNARILKEEDYYHEYRRK